MRLPLSKRFRMYKALFLLLLFSVSANAADTARSRMQAFSKDLKSVTADFSQSVTDANDHRSCAGSLRGARCHRYFS